MIRAPLLILGLSATFAACTCGSVQPPPPVVLSASPAAIASATGGTVTLAGQHFLGRVVVPVSRAAPATVDLQFRVRLGATELPAEQVTFVSPEQLVVHVPPGLPSGAHDVTVIAPTGLEGTLIAGLTVNAEPRLSLEDAPGGAGAEVSGITLSEEAAAFTVYAVLRDGEHYLGPAEASFSLSAGVATLEPAPDGASATLVAATPGTAQLTATEPSLGMVSVGVTVLPGAPASVVFTTPAQTIAAGACSQPLGVEVRDARGDPAPVSAPTLATLRSTSPGGTFFSDQGCTQAVDTLTVPAGGTALTFWYADTAAGDTIVVVTLEAVDEATQALEIQPGPFDHLEFAPIPSPQVEGVSFPARLFAHDAFENPVTTFSGRATLSLSPAGTLGCVTACSATDRTSPFLAGEWEGTLSASPAAVQVTAVATSGGRSGSSGPFEVLASAPNSPPLARLSAAPVVIEAGQTVEFDASGSADYQTPAEALEVSWDLEGAAPDAAPPWSPWAVEKRTTRLYPAPGDYLARVAVRDGTGAVGYASVQIHVLQADAPPLCTVDTGALMDDGATACGGDHGVDGLLSLPEALRLANATPEQDRITFAGPMEIGAAGTSWLAELTEPVEVLGAGEVLIHGMQLQLTAGEATLAGVRLRAASAISTVAPGAALTLRDVALEERPGLEVRGALEMLRGTFTGCTGIACVRLLGAATGRIRHSVFSDVESTNAVEIAGCGSAGVLLQSNLLARVRQAVRITSGCSSTTIVHNTFDASVGALSYQSPSGTHSVRNNVFTGHSASVGSGCAGTFAARDYHLLFGNAAAGCLSGDPDSLTVDPLYLLPGTDHRLQETSPAVDTAVDLGLDLNDAAPGSYFGSGPDRGGRESW